MQTSEKRGYLFGPRFKRIFRPAPNYHQYLWQGTLPGQQGQQPRQPLCHGRRGPSSSGQDTARPAQASAVGVLRRSTASWRFALLLFLPAPLSRFSLAHRARSGPATACLKPGKLGRGSRAALWSRWKRREEFSGPSLP